MHTEVQTENLSVPHVILQQLGWNRFIMMTGAKDIMADGNALVFKLPSKPDYTKNRINYVRIELEPSDTYKVTFMYYRGMNVKTISEHGDVYADQLRSLFTRETGLETSLGTMGRAR